MTKEEKSIQKEIEDYFVESAGYGRDKVRNFMDIVNKALSQKTDRITKLEKENAELKEQNRKLLESCEGATMMYEHLTKAKELIRKLIEAIHIWDCKNLEQVEAEAEQFLKGE